MGWIEDWLSGRMGPCGDPPSLIRLPIHPFVERFAGL